MDKKIGICVDLTDNSIKQIKKTLKELNLTGVKELHFIHGFQRQIYVDNFFFTQFPFNEQLTEIKKSVNDLLESLTKEIANAPADLVIKKECLVSDFPKKEIADYINEKGLNELILVTRTKHGIEGFFSSSFAEYMLRHVDADLRILREK